MIHLVIDTNVFSRDPTRRAEHFASLAKVCEAGEVRLHMAEVVEREFTTQVTLKGEAEIAKAKSALNALRRRTPASLHEAMAQIERALAALRDEVRHEVSAEFHRWAEGIGATIHPIQPQDGKAVMDAYFAGAAPFRSVKSREDIPDGFIWQVVQRVADKHGLVHVVSQDGTLLKACHDGERVIGHDGLDAFFQHEVLLELMARHHKERELLDRALPLLEEDPEVVFEALGDGLREELVGHRLSVKVIPWARSTATIVEINDFDVDEYSFDRAVRLPGGSLVIPVNFNLEADLEYWADQSPDEEDYEPGTYPARGHRAEAPFFGEVTATAGSLLELNEPYLLQGEARIAVHFDDVKAACEADNVLEMAEAKLDSITRLEVTESLG